MVTREIGSVKKNKHCVFRNCSIVYTVGSHNNKHKCKFTNSARDKSTLQFVQSDWHVPT